MHNFSCKCGAIRGHILDGSPSNRVRCYCSDCQAFGRYFGPEAGVLDPQGGTEVIQVSQSRLRFDSGLEQLACLRLSPRGLLRWYARCCNTPLGNSLPNPKASLIGLVHSCMDHASLDRDFGGRVADVNTSSALGDSRPRQSGLARTIGRFLVMMSKDRLSGRYRRSPLFTGDGRPVVEPHVLDRTRVDALKRSP
ncbi:MAG TPA: DUF6151 family protein [Gammaproteobacteria bacterium]|nr:DUF6151 family protein [Gammaproteobacteria bacterium]